jgi:hypothetical protein
MVFIVFTGPVVKTGKNCNWTGLQLQKTGPAVAVAGVSENYQLQFVTF